MRLFAVIASAALVTAGLTAAPASARPGWHGHGHGWHHRRHRVCRTVWHHHRRVRRCYWR